MHFEARRKHKNAVNAPPSKSGLCLGLVFVIMNAMKKSVFGVLALCAVAGSVFADSLADKIAACHKVKSTDVWFGGRRTVFDFEGYDAWVVEPPVGVKPLAGNPWTWTMQWRTAFVERTGVPRLLAQGWHHVAIDTFKDRMDKTGLEVNRRFQDFLVRELAFAPQARLIGMSWGGFFSVRYAAYHPECVSRIYLDAPFLNFDGRVSRSAINIGPWAKLNRKFGEWTDDPEMPVNLAGKIAAARIPVLLLYGGADQTLNPVNNAELFAARFKRAGGLLKMKCRELYGHHPHGVDLHDNTVIDFFNESLK